MYFSLEMGVEVDAGCNTGVSVGWGNPKGYNLKDSIAQWLTSE
jgi:hypothetical protein